mmetsp:Transcript_19520/g.23930  ORF Transcript_19520/g.23930 Transcript_19520/m.23930 type:complete len:508 (-) Transcript_19520:169-1692(-)
MRMLQYEHKGSDARPTTSIYNAVIRAHANTSGGFGCSAKAELILELMEIESQDGDVSVKPNTATYNNLIQAIAKDGSLGENAPVKAQEILMRMVKKMNGVVDKDEVVNNIPRPNTNTFNIVINAWSKSSHHDAAERAESTLEQMNDCNASSSSKNTHDYDDIAPDKISYSSVIHAWSSSSDPDSASRAEAVLREMIKQGPNSNARPDTIAFTSVINNYAKYRQPQKAEAILREMLQLWEGGKNMDLTPDTIIFNAVIDSWTKIGNQQGFDNAESILREMVELAKSRNWMVEPDTATFNTLIHALAKTKLPNFEERVEMLLKEMLGMNASGRTCVMPNLITLDGVILAWSRSNKAEKVLRACHVLEKFNDLHKKRQIKNARPDTRILNSILKTCASLRSNDRQQKHHAMRIAIRTMDDLLLKSSHHHGPDSTSFGLFFKACANLSLTKQESDKLINANFQQCCQKGWVNDFVLDSLRRNSPKLFRFIGLNIPPKWSRKIHPKYKNIHA